MLRTAYRWAWAFVQMVDLEVWIDETTLKALKLQGGSESHDFGGKGFMVLHMGSRRGNDTVGP